MTVLIFDCDGTLVRTERVHAEATRRVLFEHFGSNATITGQMDRFAGASIEAVIRTIEMETGQKPPEGTAEKIASQKIRSLKGNVSLVPGIQQAVAELTRYRRCVASNSSLELLELVIKEAGLGMRFRKKNIFSAQHVARPKPEPDLFLHAAQKMNADSGKCIVIGDSWNDVVAA